MRIFNLFLLLVMSFVLPVQTLASIAAPISGCATEQVVLQTASTDHASCHEQTNQLKTSLADKLCKASHNCQAFSMALLDKLEPLSTISIASTSPVFVEHLHLSFPPFSTWRPPNTL